MAVDYDEMWGVPHSKWIHTTRGPELVAIIVYLVEIPVKLCSYL
jgi:hypothetical protein